MSSNAEKIQLASEDLKFVKSQLIKAVSQTFQSHVDKVDQTDAITGRVLTNLQEFIDSAVQMSLDSMEVTDVQSRGQLEAILDSHNEVEEFDMKTHEKLRSLYASLDDKILKVCEMRKKNPEEIKSLWADSQEKELTEILPSELNASENDKIKELRVPLPVPDSAAILSQEQEKRECVQMAETLKRKVTIAKDDLSSILTLTDDK